MIERFTISVKKTRPVPDRRQDMQQPWFSVVDRFGTVARRQPDAVAVRSGGNATLTYAALDRLSNQVAHWLTDMGIAPGDFVLVSIDRSADLLAIALGILKAGAVYMPFGSSEPPARISAALEGISIRGRFGAAGIGAQTGELFSLDGLPQLQHYPEAPLKRAILPQDPAYVVFTSGSSGAPKGVLIEHGALANQLDWMAPTFAISHHDRVALKYGIGFDAALSEMFGGLTGGATLVIVPEGLDRRADSLLELLISESITVLDTVPSQLNALLGLPHFARLHSLRLVLCGGESLPRSVAERCLAACDAALWNCYGPSEATITATAARITSAPAAQVPLGKPVSNMTLRILDDQLSDVPEGAIGEIVLAGPQLARGYLGAAANRDNGFVADPVDGTRLYRTGDLGRRSAEGSLYFVGRKDAQISLRGYRIEPDEIAMVIAGQNGIAGCAVGLLERSGIPRLAAWIEIEPDCRLDVVQLRSKLNDLLPLHMRPSDMFRVDRLPLTALGKIDRNALHAGLGEQLRSHAARVPTGETELLVAGAFAEALGFDPPDADASFFELGGDSLSAVSLIVRLGEVLAVNLEVNDLFEAPSIAALAARAARAEPKLAIAKLKGGSPTSGPNAWYPVNLQQQDLLRNGLDSLTPVALAVRWHSMLDPDVLLRAFAQTVARHELLRSAFRQGEDGWEYSPGSGTAQSTAPELCWASCATAIMYEDDLDLAIPDAWLAPFRLDGTSLIRIGLLETRGGHPVVVLAAHPAICDSMSLEIVLRDLSRFHFHYVQGCELPGPLVHRPEDHRQWQVQHLAANEDRCRQLAIMAKRNCAAIADVRPPRKSQTRFTSLVLGPEIARAMAGVQAEPVLIVAAQLTMERRGFARTPIAIPVSGRQGLPETEGLVGSFSNLLLVPWVEAGPDRLNRVQAALSLARQYSDLSLSATFQKLSPALSIRNCPAVTMRYRRIAPMSPGTIALQSLPLAKLGEERRLSIDVEHRDDRVNIRLRGAPDYVGVAATFAETLRELLAGVNDPSSA